MASPLYEAALRYASQGMGTIPMAGRNGDKHPYWDLLPKNEKDEATWTPYQLANAPESTLHHWFGNGNGARSMALVCGEVSGNLAGLDFDVLIDGSCVYHEFAGLLDILEPSLALPVERTPRGGYHVYFRTPSPLATSVLALDTGHNLIELKGNGSCLNCSPSPGYATTTGETINPPLLSDPQVKTILRICKSLDRTITKAQAERSSAKGDGPLARFDAAHTTQDMVNWLVEAGWIVRAEKRGETYLTRPGKDRGVSGTVGWNGLKIFRNFSANAAPFEAGRAYGVAGLKAVLSHDGDMRALAAAQLRLEGHQPSRPDIREYYQERNGTEPTPEVVVEEGSPETEEPGSFSWFRTAAHFPELPTMDTKWLGNPHLAAFADQVVRERCVPAEYVVGAILSVLSAAIGNTRRVRLASDWLTYPQIWGCLVGEPGSGKTPAAEKVLEPTRNRQNHSMADYTRRKEEHEGDKLDWSSRPKGQRGLPPQPPALKSILISDITLEEVAQRLHNHQRGLLLDRDEILGWISSFNQYKGGEGSDRTNWLSLWSNNPIAVDRVNGTHIHVRNPFVAILGGIQPKLIGKAFADTTDGLQDRLLFFYPREEDRGERELTYDPTDEDNALSGVVNRLYQLVGEEREDPEGTPYIHPYEVRIAPDAWRLFVAKDRRYAKLDCIRRSSAFAKAATQAGRIALVLHMAKVYATHDEMDEGEIDLSTMRCAFEILEYCMKVRLHLDWLAAGKDRSTEVMPVKLKKVLAWVEKQPNKCATTRDIQRAEVASMRAKSEVEAVMHELQDLGYGTMEKVTHGTKEVNVFYLPR